jgi:5-(carboxyamino)imidazole ribonucleotide synthase
MKSAGAVMVNLLGFENAESDYIEKRDRLAAVANAHVYWYGKNESRPGRKLGHVTVLLDDPTQAEAVAAEIEAIWYPPTA